SRGARALWRRGSEHPGRADRENDNCLQGGGQDLRVQGLSGCGARLSRRLPAVLPPRSGKGWLGQDARLVQGPRRRLSEEARGAALVGYRWFVATPCESGLSR